MPLCGVPRGSRRKGAVMRNWSANGLYWTCPDCGSNLDPGERCDCRRIKLEAEERINRAIEVRGYVADDKKSDVARRPA